MTDDEFDQLSRVARGAGVGWPAWRGVAWREAGGQAMGTPRQCSRVEGKVGGLVGIGMRVRYVGKVCRCAGMQVCRCVGGVGV